MRFTNLSVFLVILSVPMTGCGEGGSSKTIETSDMQAYIDAHPELAAKQKARENSAAPSK